jgi:hypothetical protein
MTITAPQIGPLKQYRNLWRTDEVAGYLAVYLVDGVTVSDLMTVGMDTSGPCHYLLVGSNLEELSRAWHSQSSEPTVRVPKDDGRWGWEHLDEPVPVEPVAAPAPVPVEPATEQVPAPVEPVAAPAPTSPVGPPPVDPVVIQAARDFAQKVRHLPTVTLDDVCTAAGCVATSWASPNRSWATPWSRVGLPRDGDTFKPGEPVPVPVRDEEPLSRRARRTRWGTGPGSDW